MGLDFRIFLCYYNRVKEKPMKHYDSKDIWHAIYWWACLVVAVLVVPSVAFAVKVALPPGSEFAQILIFIVTCWLCVFLGMKLMKPYIKK